jgi:hypothetical protein
VVLKCFDHIFLPFVVITITAISNSRSKYKIWRDNGKPSEVENLHLQEKKKAKRHLKKTIRIEQAKQRNKEKELIMETKTKDMKIFHK